MPKSIRKSKNRYFYHIFVSPGDAPEAITLNVVRMESAHLTITVSEIQRDICEKKSSFYHTPCIRLNIGTPFGMEKLEWCRYPMVKKFRRYVCSF